MKLTYVESVGIKNLNNMKRQWNLLMMTVWRIR